MPPPGTDSRYPPISVPAFDNAVKAPSVLSSNARFTVYYQVREVAQAAWDAALTEHRETMRGLAADVLDDLS
ncbi:hypothetical protein [Plantactinospora sp. DSM 117369]